MKIVDLHLPQGIKVVERHAMHTYSSHDKTNQTDVLFIKERVIDEEGNQYPNLRMIVDPVMPIYVTKNQHRIYKNKKEREKVDSLDMIQSENRNIISNLKRALNINPKKYISRMEVINNPYVYGADIDIEAYYKMLYLEKNKRPLTTAKLAFLDIEEDLAYNTRQINCSSITIDDTVYCFINAEFMMKTIVTPEGYHHTVQLSLDEIQTTIMATEQLNKMIVENNIKIVYYVAKDEADLIIAMFRCLHESKVDFACIWNLDFDVNELVKASYRANIPVEALFCDPNVPAEFKKYTYYKDTSTDKGHYVLKWHWAEFPATFQFIDNMTLYAWNRRTQPFEDSYKLDNILNKHIGVGKVFAIDDHEHFQKYRFDEYVAYNIGDTLNFAIAENNKIKDIQSMLVMGQNIALKKYNLTTEKTKNAYYRFNKALGYIIGSYVGKPMIPGEEFIVDVGGAVLPPANAIDTGLDLILEDPDLLTLLSMFTNDADFTSIYPTLLIVLNICNAALICTPYRIGNVEGNLVTDYFSKLISFEENIVEIGSQYYNLPNYKEMDMMVEEMIKRAG